MEGAGNIFFCKKTTQKQTLNPTPFLMFSEAVLSPKFICMAYFQYGCRILVLCNVQSSAKKRLLTTHQTRRYPKKISEKKCARRPKKLMLSIAFTRGTQRADHRSPGREQGEGPASRMADWPSHGAVSKDKLKGKIAKNTS